MSRDHYSWPIFLLLLSSILCMVLAGNAQDKAAKTQPVREQFELWANYLADEQFLPKEAWPKPPDTKLWEFIPLLKQLDEGDKLRIQAIALARRYAAPADLMKKPDPGYGYHHHARDRLHFAWGVLMETGCLRKGMRLEEAVALLGVPKHYYNDTQVDWYYSSPMHVNPGLRCTLKNGRIETLEIDRW